jgi:hypothetical protein
LFGAMAAAYGFPQAYVGIGAAVLLGGLLVAVKRGGRPAR